MGKSLVTAQCGFLGCATFNADDAVHQLLGKGGKAVSAVQKRFPKVVKQGVVDRKALGDAVFHDEKARHALEAILHPLIAESQAQFWRNARLMGSEVCVSDIPLLFELGWEAMYDAVIVVTAPAFLQRQRVLARPGMTEARFTQVLQIQMPDYEKQMRADYIVQTGLGKYHSLCQIRHIVANSTIKGNNA